MTAGAMPGITAVIQAKHFSTILPGKSLLQIRGRKVIEHILARLQRVPEITDIIVATTNDPSDDQLCRVCADLAVETYRGADVDLLTRNAEAGLQKKNPIVVFVHGNYPLIDTQMMRALLQKHIDGGFEFSFNEHYQGVPLGLGCMVINLDLLEKESKRPLTVGQRESGFFHFLLNHHRFKTGMFTYDRSRPEYKLCLENQDDFNMIESIFRHVDDPQIESIITFLDNHPVIARSNRQTTISEVGLEKLAHFPEKVKAILEAGPGAPDCSYPLSIELSLTNRCNLNCVWCSDTDLRDRLGGDLELGIIAELAADLKRGGTRGIVVEGGGEPTIHKQFPEAIATIKGSGLACGLITNGTRSIAPEVLQEFDWVRVSLDASNSQEFKQLKGSDQFERVMTNIAAYRKHCQVVGIGYVVTSENCSSLEPLTFRLRDIGVNYIQFRPVIDNPNLMPNINIDYLKRYETYNSFNIITDGFKDNVIFGNGNLPCRTHSLTSVITADGGVYICGRLNKYNWLQPIGNLYKESFQEIWHGPERVKQADKLLDDGFCRQHCPECRITKYNVFINRVRKIKTTNFI